MEANPGPRLCSKLFKIPLYFEINDLIVPVSSEDGLPSSVVQRIRYHQKSDFKQSKGLIIPSVPMRDWIINQYGLTDSKVHVVINGADVATSEKLCPHLARSRFGIPMDCFCLGFVGNIYERYDFNTILHAIIECQSQIPDLFFVIVGEGPLTQTIKCKVSELCIEKQVIFTGYIQPDELGEILPAFDIGLLCLTKKNALRYGPITTKLSTYAVYHLPIISAGFFLKGYPAKIIQGLYLVPPENPHALADKIIQLYNNPKERNERAKILHDYATEKLTWNAVTEKILNIMRHDITL
jgi:glycosyltransferase involved in cell wall biosynthesis